MLGDGRLPIFIAVVVCAALTICMLVETTTWWLRTNATPGSVGLFISRTNIYLYSGRFFFLVFSSSISFLVDTGASTAGIVVTFALCFLVTAAVHAIMALYPEATMKISRNASKLLKMPLPVLDDIKRAPDDRNVMMITASSSTIFSLGLAVPYILASTYPEYRLTLASLGQAVNAVGTLLLLFFVDQILFRAIDDGTIRFKVIRYTIGRAIGFGLAGIILFCLWSAIG